MKLPTTSFPWEGRKAAPFAQRFLILAPTKPPCWGQHLLCCRGGKLVWLHCSIFLLGKEKPPKLLCLRGISKAQWKGFPPPVLSSTSDAWFYCHPVSGSKILGCSFARPVVFIKPKWSVWGRVRPRKWWSKPQATDLLFGIADLCVGQPAQGRGRRQEYLLRAELPALFPGCETLRCKREITRSKYTVTSAILFLWYVPLKCLLIRRSFFSLQETEGD